LSLTSETSNLLIKQYWEKPKALAEIGLQADTWETVRAFLVALDSAFDLDSAVGEQLDVLGRIVGIERNVLAVPKSFFGFSSNPISLGFADKFDPTRQGGLFFDKFGSAFTDFQLNDSEYRNLIKVKAAFNRSSGYLSSNDFVSIQSVVLSVFDGQAYVSDNLDMTITLNASQYIGANRVNLIVALGLLPRPQGVTYTNTVYF